jgi:exodeoxyribonuclease V alpha subunit
VEAGSVLGDVVGPAAAGARMRPAARAALAEVAPLEAADGDVPIGDGIVTLTRVHRFAGEGGIAALADAIRRGDGDAALGVLREDRPDVRWLASDLADAGALAAVGPVRDAVVETVRTVQTAAAAGHAREALAGLGEFRLLCAHRRGPYGVRRWTLEVERWLAAAGVERGGADREWYVGRPLLVTENDRALRLFNGDAGVVVATGADELRVAFDRADGPMLVSPSRVAAVETVYAMTIHKSQGSQFATAAVLLPDATSRLLTRELLYTAVTRAKRQVLVVGTEDAIRAAVARPLARASGLQRRLWGS